MSADALHRAKALVPLSRYMAEAGFGDRAKKSARCMFHEDSSASFSFYVGNDGEERWKCFAGCGGGDVVDFIARHRGLAIGDACRELIRLAGLAAPQWAPAVEDRHRQTRAPLPFNWAQCVRDFTTDHAENFAKWRALGLDFVEWLRDRQLVGLFHGKLAFPVVCPQTGQVVGAHCRTVRPQPEGGERVSWFYAPSGPGFPFIIGQANTASTIWAFESQFDLFAALYLAGWHAAPDGLPGIAAVATRGAENAKQVAGLFTKEARLVLFPQNDPRRSDRDETPAERWTREAAAHSGPTDVKVVMTPTEFKDLNDALRGGLSPDAFHGLVASAGEWEGVRTAAQPSEAHSKSPSDTDLRAGSPTRRSAAMVTWSETDDVEEPTTPPFPVECLPPVMAEAVDSVSRSKRVPTALPAVCALGVASAALGAGLEVLSDTNRTTRGNLYLLASAESGSGKSETFRLIAAPLIDRQEALIRSWRERTMPRIQSEIRVLDKEIALLERKAAKAGDPDERERFRGELEYRLARKDELARTATTPCLVGQDVTTERLGVLLGDNREVMFSGSADARKLVDNVMGRYNPSRATDESLYLAAYSGDYVRIDRQGREPVVLHRPCLAVCWLLQPDMMEKMLNEQSLSVSGFLPRALVCHTLAVPGHIGDGTGVRSPTVCGAWTTRITDLLTRFHAADKPQRISPTSEALRVLNTFHDAIVDRRLGDLADMGLFAARYAENAWRLAVVMHATHHGLEASEHPLHQETAANAVRLVEWFTAQQLNMLAKGRLATAVKLEDEVLELLEANRTRKNLDHITTREVQRARIAPTAEAARMLLTRMEADHILVGEDVMHEGGGRRSRIYRAAVKPRLLG